MGIDNSTFHFVHDLFGIEIQNSMILLLSEMNFNFNSKQIMDQSGMWNLGTHTNPFPAFF